MLTIEIYQVPDKKEKVEKVIAIWKKRAIFDEGTLKGMEEEMRDPSLLKRLQDKRLERHNELLHRIQVLNWAGDRGAVRREETEERERYTN